MSIGKKMDSAVPLLATMAFVMFMADASAEGIMLTGEDLSSWRDSTGQWQVVGDVFVNPANEKMLNVKPGTGVVVNGPAGKTAHLVSNAEFGDIKAHIEFMVPKDSNSGVYFMGRYEIQVFDSWSKTSPYPGI
ncbi:MAG: family 16 glycoside hydrolase, partial [Planctomycetota bacterium]